MKLNAWELISEIFSTPCDVHMYYKVHLAFLVNVIIKTTTNCFLVFGKSTYSNYSPSRLIPSTIDKVYFFFLLRFGLKSILEFSLVLFHGNKRSKKVSPLSKFQNEFMKSPLLPKYEPNIVRISDLYCAALQGRNP